MNLLALPLGLAIGSSLGALGGGGSILTVPALVYVLGENAHVATTVSLLIVGASALAGAVVHARAGRVRWREGTVFGLLGIAGSLVGSRLSSGISGGALLVAFSVLLLVVAAAMLRRSRRPLGATAKTEGGRRLPVVISAATVVGLLTGFFGVGGGFVVVPALVLGLALPMDEAVGTSLLVIAINAAAALLARMHSSVPIAWLEVIVFIAAAAAGTFAGSRIADRARPERLALAFSVLLVGVAIYTAARSIPALA